jgi:hypothetical protein
MNNAIQSNVISFWEVAEEIDLLSSASPKKRIAVELLRSTVTPLIE